MVLTTSAIALNGPARSVLSSIGRGEGVFNQASTERPRKAAREAAPLRAEAPQGQAGAAAAQAPDIPEHVVYGLLFRERALFRKKAREQEQKGADGAHFRDFHLNKLKLGAAQAAALDRVADEANREVTRLDREARRIIDDARAKHPGGLLRDGELPPTPPAELTELENERTGVLLRAREQLRAALGDAEFQRLEALLKADAAERMKVVVGAPAAAGQPGAAALPPAGGVSKKG
jgi:hypothetical protein